MTWFRFIIYTLAVYRYTLLLHEEDGPWRIFAYIRAWIGIRHEITPDDTEWGEHQVLIIPEGFLAEMVNCPYCLSGWFSIVAAFGLHSGWRVLDLWAIVGAIWAIPHYLYKRLGY